MSRRANAVRQILGHPRHRAATCLKRTSGRCNLLSVKIAAYQSSIPTDGRAAAVEGIRKRIDECEREGVSVLCCPEAIIGGLADQAERPFDIAIDVGRGQLDEIVVLYSSTVTTIVGFSEVDNRILYNSAAVIHRGKLVGIYRKQHPAIRRSVYTPGSESPVFLIGNLTIGILICNDSNFPEIAREMAAQGASILFVPSNNALREPKAIDPAEAHEVDRTIAEANNV